MPKAPSDTLCTFFLLGIARKTHLYRAEKRANKPRQARRRNMPNENDPKNQQTEGEAAGATDPKEGVGAATEGNDQQTGKPTEGSGTSLINMASLASIARSTSATSRIATIASQSLKLSLQKRQRPKKAAPRCSRRSTSSSRRLKTIESTMSQSALAA